MIQSLNSSYLYVSFPKKYDSSKVSYQFSGKYPNFKLENRKEYEKKNGYRLEIKAANNLDYNRYMFGINFTLDWNIGHIDITSPEDTFTREIVLSTDSPEVTGGGHFEEKTINITPDHAAKVTLRYLPDGRETWYNEAFPELDGFHPKNVDIKITGNDAKFFKYEVVEKDGVFSSIELWSTKGDKHAALEVIVTGKNGNTAVMSRELVSIGKPNIARQKPLQSSLVENKKQINRDTDTYKIEQNNAENPPENKAQEIEVDSALPTSEDNDDLAEEKLNNTPPEANEAIEEQQLEAQEENQKGSKEAEEEIVFKEILELSNQKIGLNQSSWELLETMKHGASLDSESFSETILDLSQSTDEMSMDKTLDWLSETTGFQVEVETLIEENRYLLLLTPYE